MAMPSNALHLHQQVQHIWSKPWPCQDSICIKLTELVCCQAIEHGSKQGSDPAHKKDMQKGGVNTELSAACQLIGDHSETVAPADPPLVCIVTCDIMIQNAIQHSPNLEAVASGCAGLAVVLSLQGSGLNSW